MRSTILALAAVGVLLFAGLPASGEGGELGLDPNGRCTCWEGNGACSTTAAGRAPKIIDSHPGDGVCAIEEPDSCEEEARD